MTLHPTCWTCGARLPQAARGYLCPDCQPARCVNCKAFARRQEIDQNEGLCDICAHRNCRETPCPTCLAEQNELAEQDRQMGLHGA
jgi:hypothetical protein